VIKFTDKQIKANREYVAKVCEETEEKANKLGLKWAVLVHWDPLANCLDKRAAYFEEYYDCSVWVSMIDKEYREVGDLVYHIYRG